MSAGYNVLLQPMGKRFCSLHNRHLTKDHMRITVYICVLKADKYV